jgi:hypothetical protein
MEPIKKLNLKRETVKSLGVKTHVQTGGTAIGIYTLICAFPIPSANNPVASASGQSGLHGTTRAGSASG